MTVEEWWTCDDPSVVLKCLAPLASARRVRLALCGGLRAPQVWPLLTALASRRAVDVGEAFADGATGRPELGRARAQANSAARRMWRKGSNHSQAAYLANFVCLQDRNLMEFLHLPIDYVRYLRLPAVFLLDVFGNPFRKASFDPRWRTADVLGLARAIYEDRAFDRLPILADALMDAGCDDEQIISHCRDEGPHVRGCWVVDLVLDKQ